MLHWYLQGNSHSLIYSHSFVDFRSFRCVFMGAFLLSITISGVSPSVFLERILQKAFFTWVILDHQIAKYRWYLKRFFGNGIDWSYFWRELARQGYVIALITLTTHCYKIWFEKKIGLNFDNCTVTWHNEGVG